MSMNSLRCSKSHYLLAVARLLVVVLPVLVSGCLVNDKKSSKTITRSTDYLRTITGNEYFQYSITGQHNNSLGGAPQSISGTLTVKYTKGNLLVPFSSVYINAIQEESTLATNIANQTVVRWLQQDAATGALSVSAIELNSKNYYVGQSNVLASLDNVQFLPSPIPLSGNNSVDFKYFDGCDLPATSCNTVVAIMTEDTTFKGNTDIQTNVGLFSALKYDFAASTLSATIPGPFDIRGACSSGNGDYSGTSYIFPEVGPVLMDYTCTSADGSGVIDTLRLNLTSTNVNIPKP